MANCQEQLDRISLMYVKITPAQRKEIKLQRKRVLRRLRKNIELSMHNKYKGWAG